MDKKNDIDSRLSNDICGIFTEYGPAAQEFDSKVPVNNLNVQGNGVYKGSEPAVARLV